MAEVESIERLLDAGLRQTLADIVTAISAINDAYRALLDSRAPGSRPVTC